MSSDLADMYQEVIIDHGRYPHNFRGLEDATRTAEGVSPPCGDELTVYLVLTDSRICDIAVQGSGGAISQASASLMTTVPAGRSEAEALALFGDVHAMMTEGSDGEVGLAHLGRFAVLAGLSESRCGSTTQRSHGTRFEAPSTPTAHGSPGSRHR